MNQILSFQNSANGRRILLRNTRNLCIFLIIFALVIIGEGSWNLYTNLNKEADVDKPVIIGRKNMDKTIFNVKSNIGVQKIIYSWNEGEETTIDKAGEKETTFEIENKIGVNELLLKVVDSDGNTITYDNVKVVYDEDSNSLINNPETPENEVDWRVAVENDKTPPEITLSAEKGKVVIDAIDDVRMSYVMYSWNGGEETKVTGLSEDEKMLNAKVDALKGDNKIKIKAYDVAGNVKELEKDVHGTDGPKITAVRQDDQIIVTVSDEYGLTKIEHEFNGEQKTIDNIEGTTYELKLDLKDGENYIIIYAYEGNVKSEYKGKTTK